MSEYLKPQSPLYHKTEDAYFYPLTTVDQVMLENGERLNSKLDKCVVVDTENVNIGEPNPVNADTLGGNSLEDIKGYVNNQITNRVIHSGGKNLLNINNPTKTNTIIASDGSFEENNGFMTYRIPSTGGYMTISFAPQSRFDAIRYASEIDGVITRYSSLSGVTVDASQWDALWISIMPIDDFVTNVMVEAGSVATEYEPYYEGLKELSNISMELLWENASPTSEFVKQEIALDIFKYQYLQIEYLYNSADVVKISHITKALYCGSLIWQNYVSDTILLNYTRVFNSSYGTKITFGDSFKFQKSSSNETISKSNGTIVPIAIYGIKGVSV